MKKNILFLKLTLAFLGSIAHCAPKELPREPLKEVMVVADNISHYLKSTVSPFEKEKSIHVLVRAGDSATGLDLILKGEADIAAITRELYSEEKQKHPELTEDPIASDALVFIVHPSNPLKNLTKENVQTIYTRKNIQWAEFIGRDHPLSEKAIRPMSKTQKNGAFKAFMRYFKFAGIQQKGKVMSFQQYPNQKDTQKVSSVGTDQATVAQLAVLPESIAFVSLTALSTFQEGKDFKIVSYNNVYPSVQTTFNRTYPLTYRLNFVRNSQHPSPLADQYLSWILDAEGQDIFRNFGLAPINLKTKIIHTTSSLTQFRRY